jgi:hypothetical protein
LLVDERVMAFEAVKWLGLDPLAPWTEPLGGSGTWRPLLVYLFRVDAEAPAVVRHLVSVALYGGLVVGVLVWLRGRFPASGAFWGAAWFAVHGAHVAVGGWVGGRADLAMGLVAVLALIAWDRGRVVLAVGLAVAAVLTKETAVVLPLVMAALPTPASKPRAAAWGMLVGGTGAAFAVTLGLQNVDPGYLPSAQAWGRAAMYWPLFALETAVPTFRPIGVPRRIDLAGLVVAGAVFAAVGLRARRRSSFRRGLLAAGIAALPVLHVLPNDGGQWYLLLPTVAMATCWADVSEEFGGPARSVLIAGLLAVGLMWSGQWAEASQRVDARIQEGPGDAPPRQDPRRWPHLGPSFCCGLPYQIFADPRAGLSPRPPL